MSNKSKYTPSQAAADLSKKRVKFTADSKKIEIPGGVVLGVNLLGKLDYLVNHCGFYVVRGK
jgi:hypothetical protein